MIFFKSQGTMALQTFSNPKTRVKPNESFCNGFTSGAISIAPNAISNKWLRLKDEKVTFNLSH